MPRIIAGSARGISLLVPEGLDTRPTADSRKEAIFSSIQFDIPGSRFLDLFAGSGAAGLEALSRGAQKAVFVEAGHKAAVCIQKNMEKTRLAQNARLLEETAEQAIGRLAAEGETFDLTFGLMHTIVKSAVILIKVLSMVPEKRQTISPDNFRKLEKGFHRTLPERILYEK